MLRFLFVYSIAFFVLTSCNRSGDSSKSVPGLKAQTCVNESELLAAGIVGGTRVNQEDSDAKMVMMLYSSRELCTAAALTPRILLTAAHCVAGPAEEAFAGFHTSLSCESGFDSRHNTIKVKEFIVHPDYEALHNHTVSKNDIALVILSEDIPVGYPTYRIADPTDLADSNSLYSWGYGDTGYKSGGAGILRKTQFAKKDFEVSTELRLITINQSNGHGICQGDSGGPGLVKIDDELEILGVNSSVQTSTGQESMLCADKANLTLVQPYLDWIITSLEKHGEKLLN